MGTRWCPNGQDGSRTGWVKAKSAHSTFLYVYVSMFVDLSSGSRHFPGGPEWSEPPGVTLLRGMLLVTNLC